MLKKKVKIVWNRLFGFKIGDRVIIKRTAFSEQKEFIGKTGIIVEIRQRRGGVYLIPSSKEGIRLTRGTEEAYGVRLDEFDWGERIWVRGDWIEIV